MLGALGFTTFSIMKWMDFIHTTTNGSQLGFHIAMAPLYIIAFISLTFAFMKVDETEK
jgi:hypothetical protein